MHVGIYVCMCVWYIWYIHLCRHFILERSLVDCLPKVSENLAILKAHALSRVNNFSCTKCEKSYKSDHRNKCCVILIFFTLIRLEFTELNTNQMCLFHLCHSLARGICSPGCNPCLCLTCLELYFYDFLLLSGWDTGNGWP